MKKVLLTIAAAVALVACTNDEVIGTYQDAIGFEGAYVENATRAAIDKTYDNDNLQEFQVYATISNTTGTANIFEGEKVVRGNSLGQGTNWSYDATNTQYWVAGNTYNFRAVADGNVENATEAVTDAKGLLTGVKLLDVNAQRDILFAEQMAVDYTAGEGAKTVKFTFRHLLSKVKFTFKNTIATDNGYGYEVTNIAINNTAKSAEYTIGGKWEKTAEVANVAFGNATSANEENAEATLIAYNGKEESNLERLLVPGTENMNITFTYTLYKDDVVIDTQDKTIDTDAITLEEGGAYNFVISLGNPGEPIHFDVEEVTEWVPAGGEQVSMVTVSTVEDFLAAVANPEVDVITLSGDLVLNDSATRATADPTVTVKKDKTLAINLGGYTLSATSTNTGKNYNMFDVNGGELTVTNGKLVYEHKGANMGWNSSTNLFNITAGGVLNLDGVTAQNLGGSDMAFVAHLNNWGEATLNVNNSTLESTYIAVRAFNSGHDMNNITIKNSTLKGKYCFWVHNYKAAGDSAGDDSTLNLDIFNGTNTFEYTGKAPVLYGFDTPIYFDENGNALIADGISQDAQGVYYILDVTGLKNFAAMVNAGDTFEGKTVKLNGNIDLNNEHFTPIGYWETFDGTFDGQNYTISNLKHHGTAEDCYVALFGYTNNANIKNLTIENVDIKLVGNNSWAGGHCAALVGRPDGTSIFENITVTGLVKIEGDVNKIGAGRIGGVVGGNQSVHNITFKNVVVDAAEGSYVKGSSSIGGIAGQLQGVDTYENVVSNIDVIAQDFAAGGIVGIASAQGSFKNCSTSGDVTILAASKENNWYRIGGIAGCWDDNITYALVLENCAYTGTLTSGDVTEFDNEGYVGRGYSLTEGAKGVIIK